MSWREIFQRATNKMLGSWSFPGKEGNALWKLQSNSNQARIALQEAYTHFTKRKVSPLAKTVNGETTYFVNLPLNQDFSYYPDMKAVLEKSKLITYRYGPLAHFMTFIYDDSIKRWVPLLAVDEVINLADWLIPFDDDGSMEDYLLTFPVNVNPIDYPYHWSGSWSMFMAKFDQTQLLKKEDRNLKKQKMDLFYATWFKHHDEDKILMQIFCDGQD